MPVIKSAKKKLRKDKNRTLRNNKIRALLDAVLKTARKSPSDKLVTQATKITDKAAKNHIIHKNKAARIKASLSKLLTKKENKKTTEQAPAPKKKSTSKKAKK